MNCERPLSDLTSKMHKLPQSMINVKVANTVDIAGNKAVQSAVSDAESRLGKNGRVLLRPSGTEPVLRVMVEGEDLEVVDKLAHELSELVATEIASLN